MKRRLQDEFDQSFQSNAGECSLAWASVGAAGLDVMEFHETYVPRETPDGAAACSVSFSAQQVRRLASDFSHFADPASLRLLENTSQWHGPQAKAAEMKARNMNANPLASFFQWLTKNYKSVDNAWKVVLWLG